MDQEIDKLSPEKIKEITFNVTIFDGDAIVPEATNNRAKFILVTRKVCDVIIVKDIFQTYVRPVRFKLIPHVGDTTLTAELEAESRLQRPICTFVAVPADYATLVWHCRIEKNDAVVFSGVNL